MPRLLWLADAARATGAPVIEMDGWRTRGSDAFNPGGTVEHHTAGARTGDVPSLNIVTHGRSDLPGPLYNFLIARNSHAIYIIGAGRANHAGQGSWKGMVGNSSMVGIGYENAGGANDPWPAGQLEVGELLTAEIMKRLNRDPDFICEHREWTTRKVDRHSTNGNVWRERVRRRMSGPAPLPQPSPPSEGEEHMAISPIHLKPDEVRFVPVTHHVEVVSGADFGDWELRLAMGRGEPGAADTRWAVKTLKGRHGRHHRMLSPDFAIHMASLRNTGKRGLDVTVYPLTQKQWDERRQSGVEVIG